VVNQVAGISVDVFRDGNHGSPKTYGG